MAVAHTTACPDWERRIVSGESLIALPPAFPTEAEAALDVFRELRVVDVQGSPTLGALCRPWVLDFVAAIFGSYDPDTGRRMIREFLLSVSKKNSKSSSVAAGVMMTALIRNWRNSASYYILSPTIEIANNSFHPARDMVRADEELSDLFQVQDHLRTITHRNTGATLKVVAAETETVGGLKGSGVLVDELWIFGKRPNAENMLREATGGQASRPEGFTIFLTTQSDEPPAGVFKQKLAYARGVRDGRIDDSMFLPVLYEFPQKMLDERQYLEPRNFYVTNPNLGASVDEEFISRELRKAEESGEESMCGFLAKHLNIEIGLALKSDRWAGADHWQSCADPTLTLDTLLERSEVVVAGIDGGGLDDLLGLALLGRERGTRRWLLWTHAWAHKIVLERRKDIATKLRDFAKQGNLTMVQTPGDDVIEVADIIGRVQDVGLLPEKLAIGVDVAGIGDIIDALTAPGREITAEQIIGISQGWRLNGAIKTAERKLPGKEMVHGGTPLMDWCVANCKVEARGNAVTITKQISGTAKIDPVMASFNAVSLMAMNPLACERKFQLFFV